MRTLFRRVAGFLKTALLLGVLSLIICAVVCSAMPDSATRQQILLLPEIVIVLDFALFGMLALATPFMWVFSLIVGTIGLGVAVGNRASRQ